jgi:hypothetical protein
VRATFQRPLDRILVNSVVALARGDKRRGVAMVGTPTVRHLIFTAHVTSSVGWTGALAVFLAHSIVSVSSQDARVVDAMAMAMAVTAWFVILPLSVASLVTGIVQGLTTAWGVFRHYWVVTKLVLTLIATGVLLLKLSPIDALAAAARTASAAGSDFISLRTSLLVHAVGGLLILLGAIVLAIYKPRGMTRYGVRRAREAQGGDLAGTAFRRPGWVLAAAVVAALLALVIALMWLHGGHGPGAHATGTG